MFSLVDLIVGQLDLCLTQEAFAVIIVSRILDKIEEYGLEELRTPIYEGHQLEIILGKFQTFLLLKNTLKVYIMNLLSL